ncbi:hypothetical protein NQ314_021074 [Rhamnusium bicolor]|uniref:Uncharacterized protein n=1 Tax=Rhamnusium bicolor TaxID=1586634 RepID=A0AAV8WJV8_9CUCU|nr:hypothetical protein NQ314_021074 [Rhamnusium bicolor]
MYQEPVTDIFVEIQSRFIEIYSVKFSVYAQFSGLRYVMFHWPVLSAAFGMFFIFPCMEEDYVYYES